MRSKLFIIAIVLLFAENLTAQGSLEQYCYLEKDKTSVWVPLMHYRTTRGWYAEGRYNYEAMNTFSMYVGKEFSRKGKLSTSLTPLAGAVVGEFKGCSAGLNIAIDYRKFFFSVQSQYTMSANSNNRDFFFSWSELVYQPARWIYFGLSSQHTYYSSINSTTFEPGAVAGFQIGKWTFPVYCFNASEEERYFVLGINVDLAAKSMSKQ
jgi:hypothetical protein